MTRSNHLIFQPRFPNIRIWLATQKEKIAQTISAIMEGFGWVAGACLGNLSILLNNRSTTGVYIINSIATGSISCLAGCGTDRIIDHLFKHKAHETRWEGIAGATGTFLCNGMWQIVFEQSRALVGEENLFSLFLTVGAGSAAFYMLPLLTLYGRATLNGEFKTLFYKRAINDSKSVIITYLSSALFIFTSIPGQKRNPLYVYTDYGIQPSIETFILDCLKSGFLTGTGYFGSLAMITLTSTLCNAYSQQLISAASAGDMNSSYESLDVQ